MIWLWRHGLHEERSRRISLRRSRNDFLPVLFPTRQGMKPIILFLAPVLLARADDLSLPLRTQSAKTGALMACELLGSSLKERESAVVREFVAGNVPDIWRKFVPITVKATVERKEHTLILQVAPDVLTLGSARFFAPSAFAPFGAGGCRCGRLPAIHAQNSGHHRRCGKFEWGNRRRPCRRGRWMGKFTFTCAAIRSARCCIRCWWRRMVSFM